MHTLFLFRSKLKAHCKFQFIFFSARGNVMRITHVLSRARFTCSCAPTAFYDYCFLYQYFRNLSTMASAWMKMSLTVAFIIFAMCVTNGSGAPLAFRANIVSFRSSLTLNCSISIIARVLKMRESGTNPFFFSSYILFTHQCPILIFRLKFHFQWKKSVYYV